MICKENLIKIVFIYLFIYLLIYLFIYLFIINLSTPGCNIDNTQLLKTQTEVFRTHSNIKHGTSCEKPLTISQKSPSQTIDWAVNKALKLE